jgi:type IV fimbrial biogenesis protein FimT
VRMSRTKPNSGFSLIELMVTITVLAITLAIAVPAFSGVIGESKLRSQAGELQSALAFARTEAIRLNQSVVFCHSSNGQTCSTPSSSGWEGWLVSAAGAALATPAVPASRTGFIAAAPMRVSSGINLAAANHAIRFTPQGLARGFTNNIPLSDLIRVCISQASVNPNTREIQFSSGGRSRVVASDNGGTCP